jgi:beta-glucosidase/6-phospho-beta-glucosidase/beta-galactosidase
LDEFLCPKVCTGKLDFVGLDYYWGISTLRLDRILRLIDAAYRRFDRAPVWPGALYGILKDLQNMFPEKSLFIFENGSVEVADNMDRATYIDKHVDEVKRALRDGINVDGYICWALTSNREWDCEFSAGSDFGLIHIDLDGDPFLIRGPFTPAAIRYMQIIRGQAP